MLGLNYFHPYQKEKKGYIVDGSDFIEEGEGTGLVHLAPAFGAEDFATAKKEKLMIECPLEPNGVFNEKIAVPGLIELSKPPGGHKERGSGAKRSCELCCPPGLFWWK